MVICVAETLASFGFTVDGVFVDDADLVTSAATFSMRSVSLANGFGRSGAASGRGSATGCLLDRRSVPVEQRPAVLGVALDDDVAGVD